MMKHFHSQSWGSRYNTHHSELPSIPMPTCNVKPTTVDFLQYQCLPAMSNPPQWTSFNTNAYLQCQPTTVDFFQHQCLPAISNPPQWTSFNTNVYLQSQTHHSGLPSTPMSTCNLKPTTVNLHLHVQCGPGLLATYTFTYLLMM